MLRYNRWSHLISCSTEPFPVSAQLFGVSTLLMARIYPFRALRYNPAIVRLEDVVTQPYDKITPSMQQSYYQRSPYNLVRIILGLPELFDTAEGENVYTRAARDLCRVASLRCPFAGFSLLRSSLIRSASPSRAATG